MAWPLIALIALRMTEAGFLAEALAVLLMFCIYARPGEVFDIRRRDLVESMALGQTWAINLHPAEDLQSSKVDVSNETILLDCQEMPWLGAALSCQSTFPDASLLPTSYQQVTAAWNLAQKRLKLGKRSGVLYQLRHSGASWDRFKNYRSSLDVKLRGRWSSDHSLRRYEQHALVAQHYEELPRKQRPWPQLLLSSSERWSLEDVACSTFETETGSGAFCWVCEALEGLCASWFPCRSVGH